MTVNNEWFTDPYNWPLPLAKQIYACSYLQGIAFLMAVYKKHVLLGIMHEKLHTVLSIVAGLYDLLKLNMLIHDYT